MIFPALHEAYFDRVKEYQINNSTKSKNGVYRVFLANKKDNPTSIERAGGKDTQGTIYIGKSTNIFSRVGKLVNLLNDTQKSGRGHVMGVRYQTHPILKKLFPVENLRIEMTFCEAEPQTN